MIKNNRQTTMEDSLLIRNNKKNKIINIRGEINFQIYQQKKKIIKIGVGNESESQKTKIQQQLYYLRIRIYEYS